MSELSPQKSGWVPASLLGVLVFGGTALVVNGMETSGHDPQRVLPTGGVIETNGRGEQYLQVCFQLRDGNPGMAGHQIRAYMGPGAIDLDRRMVTLTGVDILHEGKPYTVPVRDAEQNTATVKSIGDPNVDVTCAEPLPEAVPSEWVGHLAMVTERASGGDITKITPLLPADQLRSQ